MMPIIPNVGFRSDRAITTSKPRPPRFPRHGPMRPKSRPSPQPERTARSAGFRLCPYRAYQAAILCILTQYRGTGNFRQPDANVANMLEIKAIERSVLNTGEATRTPDLRIMRPPL
jgi:hypothetical protein